MQRPRLWVALLAFGVVSAAAPAPRAAADGLQFSYVEGAGGVPLSVAQVGPAAAPGILFIHGIGQSHLSFSKQLHSNLSQHYHLVAFDLRGHGNSGKPSDEAAYLDSALWAEDVQKVLAATGLQRPLIVAWSYGTLIIVDYVRHHGTDGLAGIVMIGATGGLVPYPKVTTAPQLKAKMQELYQLSVSPGLEDSLLASRRTNGLLTYRPMPPQWTATSLTVNAMVPPYARAALVKHMYSQNPDVAEQIHVPLLLIAGSEDKGDPASMLRKVAAVLPLHADIKVYPGSGHSPFAEQPVRFNRDLENFAKGVLTGH